MGRILVQFFDSFPATIDLGTDRELHVDDEQHKLTSASLITLC